MSAAAGPLRVALEVGDPERRRRLARLLADHYPRFVLAEAGECDVRLIDRAAGASTVVQPGPPPALVLSDARDVAADRALPGVLGRAAPDAALLAALSAVAAGLRVREQPRAAPLGFAAAAPADDAPGALTPREMQILGAVGEGLSNKAVARQLGISAHTVKFHLEAVFAKLAVTTRAEAVAKGLRRGLIEL